MPGSICRFYFWVKSAINKDILDTVFEYGTPIEKLDFSKKEFEMFLFVTLQNLIFFENQKFTYSSFAKSLFVISEKRVKLLNPFGLKNLLKDVLNVYMNPMKGFGERNMVLKTSIKQNIMSVCEVFFGFLIGSDESQVKEKPGKTKKRTFNEVRKANH